MKLGAGTTESIYSHKKTFGAAIGGALFLLLLVFILLRIYGFSYISHFIGYLGDSLVIILICFLVVIGIGMTVHAYLRIREEEKLWKQLKKDLDATTNKSTLFSLFEKKLQQHRQTILCNRLDTLFNSSQNLPSEQEQTLPSLRDLHDITLHDELSQTDSSWVNIIISILLILGILGTLMGVHDVLAMRGGITEGINELSPALQPSALAVLNTVLLLILRAIYLAKMHTYVRHLDELTLHVLLPIFSSKSNKLNVDTLATVIQGLPHLKETTFSNTFNNTVYAGTEEVLNKVLLRIEKATPLSETQYPEPVADTPTNTVRTPLNLPKLRSQVNLDRLLQTQETKVQMLTSPPHSLIRPYSHE